MKRTKALLITALAAALLMGGCGDKKDTTTATTAAAATTTEAGKDDTTEEKKTTEEKSESTTATEAETEASTEAPAEDALTVTEARELMNALNSIDFIGACALDNDSTILYEDENGHRYHPVTDPDFKTLADIENYVNQYLTEEFINERYKGITGTDTPEYMDVDGA